MTSWWLGEYDGRYNNVIPDCVANPCATVRTGCLSKGLANQVAINGPPLRGPGSPGDWGSTPAGPPNRLLETLSTIAVNRRGPPPLPGAELGVHGLNRWTVKCMKMVEKRGVHAARNGSSPSPTPTRGPGGPAGDQHGGSPWFKGTRGRGRPLCGTNISFYKIHFHSVLDGRPVQIS